MIRLLLPMLKKSSLVLTAIVFVASSTGLVVRECQAQLAGRAIAQPYFDYPNSARFENCRPSPSIWQCDPEDDCQDYCGNSQAHRPSGWYGIAEFAPMLYDARDDITLLRKGTGVNAPARLETADLLKQFDPGGKFTIGRTLNCCYRLEGTYLGNYGWSNTKSVTDTGMSSILDGFTTAAQISGTESLATYLQSGELNVRGWLDMPPGPFDVSFLVGARYVKVNEDFNFITVSTPGPITAEANTATKNSIGGPQIGLDFQWMVNRSFYWDFDAKGALLMGTSSQSTTYTVTALAPATQSASGSRTAFLVDLSLTGNYQMTRNLTIRGGYQALFLDGIALGKDNWLPPPQGNVNQLNSSGAIYHGPTLGVIWAR